MNAAQVSAAHDAIDKISQTAYDSAGWNDFTRELSLPVWALPAIQWAVRQNSWRRAFDPLDQIRTSSTRKARRMDLKAPAKVE